MNKQHFDTGKEPHINITESHGNIVIRGWDRGIVQISGDQLTVEEMKTGLTIVAHGDVSLTIPTASQLSLKTAHADLVIKNIHGPVYLDELFQDVVLKGLNNLTVGRVHHDFVAHHINGSITIDEIMRDGSFNHIFGNLTINRVHGDSVMRHIRGNLSVNEISGDAAVNTVNGDFSLKFGHRDLSIRNVGGKLMVEQVQGDIRLRGSLGPGKHHLHAAQDIVVRWPGDEPFNLLATAPKIKNQIDGLTETERTDNTLTASMGDSETTLILDAKRAISLKGTRIVDKRWTELNEDGFDIEIDLEGLGQHIATEINSRLTEAAAHLEATFGKDFSRKIEIKAEQAAKKAEEALNQISRNFEATRKQQRTTPTTPPSPAPKPTPPTSTSQPMSEQLKVLQMVENGTISVDEAATLLKALDSNPI